MKLLRNLIPLVLGLAVHYTQIMNMSSVEGSDLQQDYVAAQALRNGEALYPTVYGIRNNHTPLSAIVFYPFAFAGSGETGRNSARSYCLISIALFCAALYIYLRSSNVPYDAALILTGLFLLWQPTIFNTQVGSQSLLLASSITAGWTALRKERSGLAGFLFGFAASLKLFPLLIGLYLIFCEKIKVSLWFVFWIIILNAFCLLIVGPNDFVGFAQVVFSYVGSEIANPLNIAIDGLALKIFGTSTEWYQTIWPSAIALQISSLILKATILIYLLQVLYQKRSPSITAFGASCCAMLLLSPATWSHAITILCVPVILQLGAPFSKMKPSLPALLIIVLLSIPDLMVGRFFVSHFGTPIHWYWSLLLSFPTFAIAMFLYILSKQHESNTG